ncbi:pilin [Halioxenophilus sp. WMMB6]|uniref:pilin n=1 Tax=Halioxenophilus sp. WMMB6 TaxID=3073815 RepID=UPI00295F50F5|nr:pilin [Halioxenophilus sp. WMMB6]
MNNQKGFTLIELMIVVAIIGILASVALPAYQVYVQRSEMVEALSMAATIRQNVTNYYVEKLVFPADNASAGIPEPQMLIGNRITSVQVDGGAIHVTLGNKVSQPLQGKVLTFRPAVVTGSPKSPIAWLCGYDEPVNGMTAVGDNKTDLEQQYLPSACRG